MNASAWVKGHKPEAALGAGGIAVTILLALRARSKAAAGPASSSSSAVPNSTLMPVSTADTTASDVYSGLESQVVGLQSAILGLQHPDNPGTPAPAPAGTPAPSAPQPSPGFGEVPTAAGDMVWLGVTGAGGSTAGDYQVGGGAPVFFGNAGALAQGGTQAAGVDVYTPVAYAPQVSAKAGA